MSEGLEGRSKNPVALLFDALFHPGADIGEEQPSPLEWVRPKDQSGCGKRCSHIVIGEERPGGQWHAMDPTILTLSLNNWLQLPIFGFEDWKKEKGEIIIDGKMPEFYPSRANARLRAATGDIAQYYEDYVTHMDLQDNFQSGLRVTKVTLEGKMGRGKDCISKDDGFCPIECGKSKQLFHEDNGVVCPLINECHRWIVRSKRVRGDGRGTDGDVIIRAKNLVLAGGLGLPRKLGVAGEERDYVISLKLFQSKLESIKQSGGRVLVVGAGMSGADLVLQCMKEHVPCYHVFKQRPDDRRLLVAGMEPGIYQEYHYLSRLMKGVETNDLYTPFSQHSVKEFKENGECLLADLKTDTLTSVKVTQAIVMVGYTADLDFLPEDVRVHLLSDNMHLVHSKNPLDVDLYSFRNDVFPNLYAIGPLTGDNFVRFVFGSGLGCAQNILYNVGNN